MEPATAFEPRIIQAGDGIELRPATADDAPALYALIDQNRAHLAVWLAWATPEYSEAGVRSFLADRAVENVKRQALTTTIWAEGAMCGSIAIHQIDWLRNNASLGYWIETQCGGRGIVTRACRALVSEAFAGYGLHRVEIRCAVGNDRSAAIPLRLGFREEGVLREAELLHGRYLDLRLFSMLRHEWAR